MANESGLMGTQEVSEVTGISAFTIRYYDKCGVRSFTQDDVRQLMLVDSLRKSGLSIEGIGYYIRLMKKGDATIEDRLAIMQTQTTALEYQIAEAQNSLDFLKEAQHRLLRKSEQDD